MVPSRQTLLHWETQSIRGCCGRQIGVFRRRTLRAIDANAIGRACGRQGLILEDGVPTISTRIIATAAVGGNAVAAIYYPCAQAIRRCGGRETFIFEVIVASRNEATNSVGKGRAERRFVFDALLTRTTICALAILVGKARCRLKRLPSCAGAATVAMRITGGGTACGNIFTRITLGTVRAMGIRRLTTGLGHNFACWTSETVCAGPISAERGGQCFILRSIATNRQRLAYSVGGCSFCHGYKL